MRLFPYESMSHSHSLINKVLGDDMTIFAGEIAFDPYTNVYVEKAIINLGEVLYEQSASDK